MKTERQIEDRLTESNSAAERSVLVTYLPHHKVLRHINLKICEEAWEARFRAPLNRESVLDELRIFLGFAEDVKEDKASTAEQFQKCVKTIHTWIWILGDDPLDYRVDPIEAVRDRYGFRKVHEWKEEGSIYVSA